MKNSQQSKHAYHGPDICTRRCVIWQRIFAGAYQATRADVIRVRTAACKRRVIGGECRLMGGKKDSRVVSPTPPPCLQASPFQALQQRDGERAGRPGPRGLPGAQHRRADAGQEPPVRLLLPEALVRAGVGEPVHRVPPHRPHAGPVGVQRGGRAPCGGVQAASRSQTAVIKMFSFLKKKKNLSRLKGRE